MTINLFYIDRLRLFQNVVIVEFNEFYAVYRNILTGTSIQSTIIVQL